MCRCATYATLFLAERRVSLGKDWHPWCLKCELCGKTLNPSRHSQVTIATSVSNENFINPKITRQKV